MGFTHLQVRTGYSFYKSTVLIDNLIKRASELNFTALALTDEHVMYGVIPFYKKCLEYGIKPIIGLTVHIVDKNHEKKEQCVLLAKNNKGYKQLLALSTKINIEKRIGISFEELESLSDDIICILSLNQSSSLANHLLNNAFEQAGNYIASWKYIFKDDFYLGIQHHGLAIEQRLLEQVQVFLTQVDCPIIATQDVCYVSENDYAAYDCLRAIDEDIKWFGDHISVTVRNRHLSSEEEMIKRFGENQKHFIERTEEIVAKCQVSLDLHHSLLPSYPVPGQSTAQQYLEMICWDNVGKKYTTVTDEIKERLVYELQVIQEMNFSDYFLIVWDFVSYAKQQQIMVGPGRGSAAGSLVAYVLGITDIDPLEYGLLFERFLNPERKTMPDIDIDFLDHRRDEVIDYVREKYGEQHVAQIITFGTFAARSVLRELFKTMEVDERDAKYILKRFSSHHSDSIRKVVNDNVELREYIKQSPKLKLLFNIALKLEGLPRHSSTHAAGVIISDEPLVHHVPLTIGSQETYITQYPMNDLADIGLLKIDFLGLRNLTTMERIVDSIKRHTGKEFHLNEIPSDDAKTFALLQAGLTNGIFQLESKGMKNVLKELKPTTFSDIVAVSALYRPGPIENIPTYINRKHDKEKVAYLHPALSPILEDTYGVLVYQEQIMQIVHKIAGYTLGEADVFRRAVSKKQAQVIEEQQSKFIKGCLDNGYDEQIAIELFHWIVKFSNYGFNKSHAVAYSKISYQLAYLKAHYPAFFYTELLNSVTNQHDKIAEYLKEAKELQMDVAPPSINKSFGFYKSEGNKIRMGLQAIKGIGFQTVKEIIEQRKQGSYKNLFDFCLRVSLKIVQRQLIEALILTGAFDELHPNRASLLESLDQAMEQGELFGGLSLTSNLFTDKVGYTDTYNEVEDFTSMKKLQFEKELLGFYVSDHPMTEFRKKLQLNGFVTLQQASGMIGKKKNHTAVLIQAVKEIRTKRGDPMAFIKISDETMEMEAVVFPELYRLKKPFFKEENIVLIVGSVEERNHALQWVFQDITPFHPENLPIQERLFIKFQEQDNQKGLTKLKEIANKYPGKTPIFVFDAIQKRTFQMASQYHIHASQTCLEELRQQFGKSNVVLEQL